METLEERAAHSVHDRRSFLGKLGKTLAVGLGFGLVTSAGAAARTDACAIYCSPVGSSCSTACCDNPPCSTNLFHCTTLCGYDYYQCMSHACSGFCFSPNAC